MYYIYIYIYMFIERERDDMYMKAGPYSHEDQKFKDLEEKRAAAKAVGVILLFRV